MVYIKHYDLRSIDNWVVLRDKSIVSGYADYIEDPEQTEWYCEIILDNKTIYGMPLTNSCQLWLC